MHQQTNEVIDHLQYRSNSLFLPIKTSLPPCHLLLIRQLSPLLNRTTHSPLPALGNITRVAHLGLRSMFLQILHANHIQRLLARSMQMDFRDDTLPSLILLVGVVECFFPAAGAETPLAACC